MRFQMVTDKHPQVLQAITLIPTVTANKFNLPIPTAMIITLWQPQYRAMITIGLLPNGRVQVKMSAPQTISKQANLWELLELKV